MPKRIENIEIDLDKVSTSTRFTAKQYEDIELVISLINDGVAYDASNCVISLHCNKQIVSSISIENGKLIVIIASESLIESGLYECELSIADDNGTLKTPSFYFNISTSLSGEIIINAGQVLDAEGYTLEDAEGYTLEVVGNKVLKYTAAEIDGAILKVKNMPAEGIVGPKGDKGEQGIQGVPGIQGPKGDPGANGTFDKTTQFSELNTSAKDIPGAINENASQIAEITQDFNDHVANHPSGEVSIIEPKYDDIPKVFLNGNIDGMSKDVSKILKITYMSNSKTINKFVKMKWQGTSSLAYPKKNFTITLYNEIGCVNNSTNDFKGWGFQSKYCLKANYIDHTHSRNIVGARIGASLQETQLLPITTPNKGLVDGFPIKLYINNSYEGLYTWNIPKDGWTFNMTTSNPNNIVYCCEMQSGAGTFDELSLSDSDWSDEFPGTNTTDNRTKLNRMIAFVKDSDNATFKANFNQYLNLEATINYYLHAVVFGHFDGYAKNMLMVTYDGLIWFPTLYDMDSTLGILYNGIDLLPTDKRFGAGLSRLWNKLELNFGEEIIARYNILKYNQLSFSNIITQFERFIDNIPSDLYKEDLTIYSGIPSSNGNIQQIRTWLKGRLDYVDSYINSLSSASVSLQGITLSETTTSITSGATKTITVTYNPTNATNKGISWTTSNSSVATVSDGVITGVGVGSAVITATSVDGGYIATCSVNVTIAVSITPIIHINGSDTITNNVVTDRVGNSNFNATNVTTSSEKLIFNGTSSKLEATNSFMSDKIKLANTIIVKFNTTEDKVNPILSLSTKEKLSQLNIFTRSSNPYLRLGTTSYGGDVPEFTSTLNNIGDVVLAFVISANNSIKIYKNGTLIATKSTTFVKSEYILNALIGCFDQDITTTHYFKGGINFFKMYDFELSQEQIQAESI